MKILIVLVAVIVSGELFLAYKSMLQLLILIPALLILALLFIASLTVTIDADKITVQFFPFHLKPVEYAIEDISEIRIVKYNPLGQFGGWGIRFNMSREKIFSVSGNKALYLVVNGKKRYIGIRNTAAAHELLAARFPHIYRQ